MQLLFDSKWVRFAVALGREPEQELFVSNDGGSFERAAVHDEYEWSYETDDKLKFGFTNG